MLPDSALLRVVRKESGLFYASPVAYLFLAAFVAVTLFVFFWAEAFFARNISDVRPLFEWMPLLLIFLSAALTMRSWSEERRAGTLEHVLTQPQPLWHFVVGKFLACVGLLVTALALTLPLPVTVSLLGNLDWGPVWAGYVASLLLGAVYIAVGLFVSARTDNPIVALIGTTLIGFLLWLPGAPLVTGLFSNEVAEWLRLIGTGARFESIARGVIDLADLYYYLSLTALFLVLNLYSLERGRWAAAGDRRRHLGWTLGTALVALNAVAGNLWIGQLDSLRFDITEGRIYSISDVTRRQLGELEEPLLIRGYFSAKTHPLLAPLVPELTDLLREYAIAGRGRVQVEIVDPTENPELEDEANQKYGIRAVPFQVADRYQAALVNSYFNVLVQYGDQYQVLGFRDLIEIQQRSETDLDVRLRNPEYDITRAIRKVVQNYRSGGNLFDSLRETVRFEGYISADDKLPQRLRDFRETLNKVLARFREQAGDRFEVRLLEPEADGGRLAQRLEAEYGFRPMAESLLARNSFWFYLTLHGKDQVIQIPLGDLSEESLERNLKAGLQRFASGFTRTVALVTPKSDPQMTAYGMPPGPEFYQLEDYLGAELRVVREDLEDGRVSGDADILLLAGPRNLDERSLFAVDQFLMRGGTVIAATSPYSVELSRSSLSLQEQPSGLEAWLDSFGLHIDKSLVLDPQNSAMPVPVTREVGGFRFREIRMLDYPYFVEARGEQLADHPLTADLPSLIMNWASPIEVDEQKNSKRTVTPLVWSSADAWRSASTEITPRVDRYGVSRFEPEGERGPQLLAVLAQGRFDSWFAGKSVPAPKAAEGAQEDESGPLPETVIERSPESARLILLASSDFLRDRVLGLSATRTGAPNLNSLQLVANAVDWVLEDGGLLSIRSRGHFNRTLMPLSEEAQKLWEYGNYLAAAALLALLWFGHRLAWRRRQQRWQALLKVEEAKA